MVTMRFELVTLVLATLCVYYTAGQTAHAGNVQYSPTGTSSGSGQSWPLTNRALNSQYQPQRNTAFSNLYPSRSNTGFSTQYYPGGTSVGNTHYPTVGNAVVNYPYPPQGNAAPSGQNFPSGNGRFSQYPPQGNAAPSGQYFLSGNGRFSQYPPQGNTVPSGQYFPQGNSYFGIPQYGPESSVYQGYNGLNNGLDLYNGNFDFGNQYGIALPGVTSFSYQTGMNPGPVYEFFPMIPSMGTHTTSFPGQYPSVGQGFHGSTRYQNPDYFGNRFYQFSPYNGGFDTNNYFY